MSFSPAALLRIVRSRRPAAASGRLCVAFSGGLDSTVLLTALAQVATERVCAIHIDHGLQPDAAHWDQHCAGVARKLGIDYRSRRVEVNTENDEGLEAAARHARYAALRQCLEPRDVLLTAHHADDQFETLLLALLRGSGLPGLSAMPAAQEFHPGWHLRPLLEFTRAELEAWARAQGLIWISDPSNDTNRFNRNFLRREVNPRLHERWPAASRSALRSAAHAAEAATLLEDLARIDLATAAVGPCLRLDVLSRLEAPRRRNLLRYWVKLNGARPPTTRKLHALEHDMLAAQEDRLPVIEWEGFMVRRFRGLLYPDRERPTNPATPIAWDWRQPVVLPDDLGVLRTEAVRGTGLARALLPSTLRIEFRQGGELLRPAGRAHHHTLKKLLQEADILPWWRNRLPLLWAGDRLAAVGDLWTAEEFSARPDTDGLRVIWQDRPDIYARPYGA